VCAEKRLSDLLVEDEVFWGEFCSDLTRQRARGVAMGDLRLAVLALSDLLPLASWATPRTHSGLNEDPLLVAGLSNSRAYIYDPKIRLVISHGRLCVVAENKFVATWEAGERHGYEPWSLIVRGKQKQQGDHSIFNDPIISGELSPLLRSFLAHMNNEQGAVVRTSGGKLGEHVLWPSRCEAVQAGEKAMKSGQRLSPSSVKSGIRDTPNFVNVVPDGLETLLELIENMEEMSFSEASRILPLAPLLKRALETALSENADGERRERSISILRAARALVREPPFDRLLAARKGELDPIEQMRHAVEMLSAQL
jgi:hypothetical protein